MCCIMSIWISRETSLILFPVEEYEKYLKSKQLYKEGAKKIVVTGQMADAHGID